MKLRKNAHARDGFRGFCGTKHASSPMGLLRISEELTLQVPVGRDRFPATLRGRLEGQGCID